MDEYLKILESLDNLRELLLFAGSSFLGMVFAYYYKWSWSRDQRPLMEYLTGDRHAVGRALTTLAILLTTAGALDYMSTMQTYQIFVAGLGIGSMVPSKVESKLHEEGLIDDKRLDEKA